ncbi:MAG TPA: DUF2490 domain-containing protein [Chitinophagaceae bacterium]|nr:DUF2490 domain-containing protein [Chitinophagaceae bacterium]
MKWIKNCVLFVLMMVNVVAIKSQTKKEVTHHAQTWLSINSTYRFSEHWGILGDFHYRSTIAFKDPRFYFIRVGGHYWIQEKMTAAAGYAHTWLSPAQTGWQTWTNENRLYEQFLFSTSLGKTLITQRFRNEQRWIQKIQNDSRTGETKFINRVRYLLSFNFPIFKKPGLPSLVLADEVLLNFGKEVVYNTVDQNRIFIGIKQALNPHLSYDFGYMNVYQQRSSGYQYDMNHTIRLFFYYNGGWTGEKKRVHLPEHHEE